MLKSVIESVVLFIVVTFLAYPFAKAAPEPQRPLLQGKARFD